MSDLRQLILKKELEFPKTFAKYREEDFGIIFYDENDPHSHDSNHAVIYPERVKDLEHVLGHIAHFYTEKNLQPRIYQPYNDGYFMDIAPTLRKNSWDVQIYGQIPFMVLKNRSSIEMKQRLTIKEVKEWDERLAEEILIPNGSLYELSALRKRIEHDKVLVFAGYLHDRAVCLAALDYSDGDIARMDSAETVEELRGKGYARELIHYMADYHRRNYDIPLYLWPLNRTAEKIFKEAGFETEFLAEGGSAIYNRIP